MIKILIADDHPIVRKGLKQILEETTEMVVAGEASNAQEVLNKVLKEDFDIVLLDISMPGRSGLEILKEIKTLKPKLKVLILSIHPEEHYAERVLKAGASGYLTKESAPEELISAIRKVAQGRKYISPSFAERLVSTLDAETDKLPHERLSDREFEVLCMIASGKTITEIAEEMALSVKTISTYRSRILQKMNMKNNAELTYYVIKHNLLE